MAILTTLNQFGSERIVMAIEPGKTCVAKCTYCFVELNRRKQADGRERDLQDDGSFEALVEQTFGPAYDPADFRQWYLKNGNPVCMSNTAEPFQNPEQAVAILDVCRQFGIPLFVQTKGVHADRVWDRILAHRERVIFYVSIPSLDERVAKRFEPKTPPMAYRLDLLRRAATAGIYAIAGLAPYHPEWVADPEALVDALADAGVSQVFYDALHLNDRQRETCTDPITVKLAADKQYTPAQVDHVQRLWARTLERGLDFNSFNRLVQWLNLRTTTPGYIPPGVLPRDPPWGYCDEAALFVAEEYDHAQPEDDRLPFVVRWPDVLDWMEGYGSAVAQPFRFSSLAQYMQVAKLPAQWRERLKPHCFARDLFRALWNQGKASPFFWFHPHVRIARRPGGAPWVDREGNLVAIYWSAPDAPSSKYFDVEDPDELPSCESAPRDEPAE